MTGLCLWEYLPFKAWLSIPFTSSVRLSADKSTDLAGSSERDSETISWVETVPLGTCAECTPSGRPKGFKDNSPAQEVMTWWQRSREVGMKHRFLATTFSIWREQRWVESVYGRRRDITATPWAATPDRLHHQPDNATAWKEMGFDPTEMKLGLSEIQT